MYLKRLFDHSSGKPVPAGVKLIRAGSRQNFSQGFIDGGLAEGWLAIGGGKLTFTTDKGPVVYTIARQPGMYCCTCEQKLDDSRSAQMHVAAHKGASPDPCNPAGYRVDNFYACMKATDPVNAMSKDEAVKADKKIRAALIEKLSKKYGVKKAS